MDAKQVLDDLLKLHGSYSSVHRRTIALDKYKMIESIEPENELIRESLLEHVGSLPIIASYLYPFLEHKNHIDLGKVLILLAIHDIGETVTGDTHPRQKTKESIDAERERALELLSEIYHPFLEEFEKQETLESKFAKSVDVFATFLSDQLLSRDFVKKRLTAYDFSSDLFLEKRTEIFAWDLALKELFGEVIKRYKEMGL